ncbi:methyl-accepting chemotaxis protein [Duganella sp. BJB1802]|uniref:methyl-accepting chemotaxis protein n=1 Tax=Duganella sp. BJB1802 TaxID=2744575 RepID=UPI001E5EC639|nr:CHASE3 domain-containing protein [Duganella sp. BJB1802]
MLNDLSIKQKLYLGFSAILAIILALLSMAYIKFNSLSDANGWDRHSMEVIQSIDKMRNDLLQVQVEARGYYLSGTPVRLESTHKELRDLPGSLLAMQTLVADSPNQSARFKELETMIATWTRDVIESQLAMRQQLGDKPGAADAMGHNAQQSGGNVAVHGIYKLLDNAAAEERRLLAERSDAAARLQETMRLVLSGGGLACVALSALIAWALGRALLAPLNNLTHAVGRLAAGEQSARAAEGNADELGRVATEFNRMAQAIQDSQANELAATNLLKSKVDSLLGVVSKAASGDLTGKIDVAGDDAIGQLAHGLDRMFENLRALLNNVQKAGIQVTTSATEIAASARQQEATGIEQAQTSVEILSTTKEISANTSQLLKTMEDATAVADYTTSATARRPDQPAPAWTAPCSTWSRPPFDQRAKLAALSEKGLQHQQRFDHHHRWPTRPTSSLNAAIEAEKAGGRDAALSRWWPPKSATGRPDLGPPGDLSSRSKEMQSAVSASVMNGQILRGDTPQRRQVRQVTDQLSGVMDQVQKLAPQFDAVLQGMQSQAVGAQQISETMMQLNDATQQTVESLKATSEAVHQLQYAAGDLQTSVANFAVAA